MLIPIILIAVSTAIYIILYNHVNEKKIIALKLITSFLFVLIGFLAFYKSKSYNETYPYLILSALGCGFIGDVILGLRRVYQKSRKILFVLGMSMFLIGHMCNIFAFSLFSSYNFVYYLILSLFLTFIAIVIIQLSHINGENTKPAMYLYMLVCAFVVSYTFFNMIEHSNIYFILIFIGAISFASSDFMLCFLYFKKMNQTSYKVLKKINIATYYIAQTIFALSIYFMSII